jgi:hypothetical protein
LERLSTELYSRDSHFLLELLQNCDDNEYPKGVNPQVSITITEEALILRNNERGFSEADIRAICDVGRSTKTEKREEVGMIGEKGLGFKAVFRVTGQPQVHSNGFHIQFDEHSEPVGFIVPQWIDDADGGADDWATTIVLPWKNAIKMRLLEFVAELEAIDATALMFLRRIRNIVIDNKIAGKATRISVSESSGVLRLQVNDSVSNWVIFKRDFEPPVQRKGRLVPKATLSLGFRVSSDGTASASEFLSVCAFLPLCPSGFRFVIQGDFVSPASRQGIDDDDTWNQWLRSCIPRAFTDAVLERLLANSTDSLRFTWPAYLPRQGEVVGFFRAIPGAIFRELSGVCCIPTEQGSFTQPHATIVAPDEVRALFQPSSLQSIGLSFADYRLSAPAEVLASLGVKSFEFVHYLKLL